jgi:hypothetical protein
MLLPRLGLGLSSNPFTYGFPTKTMYVFLFPHACYMSWPTHLFYRWITDSVIKQSCRIWGLTVVVMKSMYTYVTPCSPLKVNGLFWGTYRLHLQGRTLFLPPAFTPVSCSSYSSTLKMEVICSSKTSVDFQRITRRYIPGDRTLYIQLYTSIIL